MSEQPEGRVAASVRPIAEIVTDRLNTNENRALECLRTLDYLSADDLTREDFRTAALVFALLAAAEPKP